jgi:glycosyltransferase involved in cell wall biosynthesis
VKAIEHNSKKLNILMVSDYPLGEIIGGSVRVLYEQSKLLAARGHRVHILTREELVKKGYKKRKDIQEWKYSVNNKNSILFLLTTIINSKKLFTFLSKKYNYDFVNFHQPLSTFSFLRLTVRNNLKKIYTCHSLSFEEFQSRNPRPSGIINSFVYQLNILIRKYIESAVLKKSDLIVVLSDFIAHRLSAVYGISSDKICVIPGGIDLKRFHPNIGDGDIRKSLNLPGDRVILFTVRNLVQRMGLANLITALKDVVQKAPDIHLILGGEGPLEKELLTLTHTLGLKDYISFVGFIAEAKLPEYYRAADIFVLPTKELEGFGLVTLEALASGLPVLGTPVGGTKEILGKFDSSFLFSDSEPDSIADLILEKYFTFKENRQVWMNVSNRCRKFTENHYSWEKNVDSFEKIYSELLNQEIRSFIN